MESRPRLPSREETITEMTTLEKIWGKFFEEGRPTERLGQFLRGIAAHLVSVVVTVTGSLFAYSLLD